MNEKRTKDEGTDHDSMNDSKLNFKDPRQNSTQNWNFELLVAAFLVSVLVGKWTLRGFRMTLKTDLMMHENFQN